MRENDARRLSHETLEALRERAVRHVQENADLTVLSYGALCRGLLAGKMTANTTFKGDDLRKSDPKFQGGRFQQYLAAVEAQDAFARESASS